MTGRRPLLLLGAAATGTLAAAWALAPREAPAPAAPGAPAFPDLASRLAEARRIEVTRHGHAVTLRLDGGAWRVAERAGWPARTARLRETLVALAELRLLEPRPAEARTGTDDPAQPGATGTRLRVLDAAGEALADIILGTARGARQSVRRWGESGAWLAEGAIAASPDPNLWLRRELADLPAQRLRRMEVLRGAEAPLVLLRPGEVDAPLVIVQPANAARPDGAALDEAGRAFEGLALEEVRRESALPGEALGESRFAFTDGLSIRLWARADGGDLWVVLRAEGDAEAAALNALWGGYGFLLPAFRARQLIPRLEDLLES